LVIRNAVEERDQLVRALGRVTGLRARPESGFIPARWDLASVAVLTIWSLELRQKAKSVRSQGACR
jgi:hypothetical protein